MRWSRVTLLIGVLGMSAMGVTTAPGSASTKGPHRPHVADDVPVTAVDLSAGRSNNSPVFAVDPSEPRFVAMASRIDAPEFGCALSVSGDGGRGWLAVNPLPSLPAGAEHCYAPEVAFDASGALYYLFVGLHGVGNKPMGVYVTTSTNRGRSFSGARRILGGNNFGVRMAIDANSGKHGRMHLVWIAAGADTTNGFAPVPNPIMAAYSDDGGNTLSKPRRVSDSNRTRVVAPALAVGPDHAVHVVYYDLVDDARDYQGLEGPVWDGPWSLVVASTVDGRRFGPGVVVDDAVAPPERPALIFTMPPASVVAGRKGLVFVAWHDARNLDWDVFVRRSTDGGRSWAEPVRVNDDEIGDRRHQYQPRLGLAPSGRLDIVFYDRRADPENLANHVSYTFSTDEGTTFAENMRLTAVPSDSQIGPMYRNAAARGITEFGARIGLLSTDDAAVAAWTDTRNSRPGEQQDIFANEARFGPRPPANDRRRGGAARTIALAGGLALIGVAVVVGTRSRRQESSARVPEATE